MLTHAYTPQTIRRTKSAGIITFVIFSTKLVIPNRSMIDTKARRIPAQIKGSTGLLIKLL